MNVDYVKIRKKFDSRTISREIIFLRTKRENGKKLKEFALYFRLYLSTSGTTKQLK